MTDDQIGSRPEVSAREGVVRDYVDIFRITEHKPRLGHVFKNLNNKADEIRFPSMTLGTILRTFNQHQLPIQHDEPASYL